MAWYHYTKKDRKDETKPKTPRPLTCSDCGKWFFNPRQLTPTKRGGLECGGCYNPQSPDEG